MKLSVLALVGVLATGSASVFAQSAPATQGKPTDQELSNLIAKAISNDATLSADAIKVSVNGGIVTLSGLVGNDADRAKAEKLARVPGVSKVENNLKSREKATTAAKKGATAATNAVSKTGEVITDEWIVTRIRTNVANDTALAGNAIEVNVKDQVVTLSGTVPTAAARTKALAVAKDVEGVKRVVNNIKVTGKAAK